MKIAVLWPYPRDSFFMDYPELRNRHKDIIFVCNHNGLVRLRGLRDIEYIYPKTAEILDIDWEVRSAFMETMKDHNYHEYKRDYMEAR